MAWTERDIPDLSGRTAVVTGANGGLGLQTALALAGAGAHVVLAARDAAKTAAAEERIRVSHPAASLEVVPLDLGDLSSVSAAARTLARHERVDLLVNNAGVMAMPQRTTADGFEMQFGVNHLGHWALTAHLLPALLRAPAARVVTVTSTAAPSSTAGPGRPTHAAGLRAVGVVRAVEDGQPALRAGAAAAVRGGACLGDQPALAPGADEHRPAGARGA
jgi:NAD(P)-dependent dehydrogenase (short-subunit alcohol dehydrogenase family)